MKYFIKIFSGSFFITLGKIFAFIIVGIIIAFFFNFINIGNVNAYEIDRTDFIVPGYARFWNCTGNRTCSAYGSTTLSKEPYTYYFSGNKFNTVANSYGAGISIHTNDGFVKGNYYTISLLVGSSSSASFVSSSHNNCDVSTSNSLNTLMSNCVAAETSNIVNDNYVYVNVDGIHELLNDSTSALITHTFVAPQSGSYLFTTFTTSSTVTNYLNFYGYKITSHGAKAPSTTDIKNALNSNFNTINNNINNVQNSINNNINSVNNNINDMKENVDNTLNGEDEDTSSSKCGVVCKLKGIWDGIVHLPQNIWNLMKGGFEAIANAFVWIFDQIKGIFIPEPECTTVTNLFDKDKTPDNYYYNSTGVKILDRGNNFITQKIEKTSDKYTVSFKNKTNSNNVVSYVRFVEYKQDDTFIQRQVSVTNGEVITLNEETSYFLLNVDFGPNAYFEELMVEPGTISHDYISFGTEEVCTKTSFFGWFEKFGNIISGFFKNLLDGILGFFSNDDVDNESSSSFFDSFQDIDHGGISGVISAPLKAIDKLTDTCTPVNLDVLGADVELPCGDTLFWGKPEVATFRGTWNVMFGGAIIYALMCKLFKVIENLKNPNNSSIEVVKL